MDTWFAAAEMFLPDFQPRGSSAYDFVFESEEAELMWLPRCAPAAARPSPPYCWVRLFPRLVPRLVPQGTSCRDGAQLFLLGCAGAL